MTTSLKRIAFAALTFSVAFVSSASAIDLAGTYSGKLTCTGLDAAGDPMEETVSDSELEISQDGTDLLASIDTLPFAGTLVNSSRDEQRRGVATLTACNNDGDQNGRVESARLVTRLSTESGKLSVKLRSVRGTDGALECSGSYRRIDDVEPALSECPVLYTCVCVGIEGIFLCGNGGAGGDHGDVHPNIDESLRDQIYVNGNDTGWTCIAQ